MSAVNLTIVLFILYAVIYTYKEYERNLQYNIMYLLLFASIFTIIAESILRLLGYEYPVISGNNYAIFISLLSSTARVTLAPLWVLFVTKYVGKDINNISLLSAIGTFLGLSIVFIYQLYSSIIIPYVILGILLFATSVLLIGFGANSLFNHFRNSRHDRTSIILVTIGPIVNSLGLFIFNIIYFVPELNPIWYGSSAVFISIAIRYDLYNVSGAIRDQVVDDMNQGMIVLNEDSKIIDYNDTALEIFGNIGTFLDCDIETFERDQEICDIFTEPNEDYDYIEVTVNGDPRFYDPVISEVTKNETIYYIVLLKDVTEMVQKNNELEQFTSILKHDLTNHLMIIQEYAKLTQTDDTDKIEKVINSATRAQEIIDDMDTVLRNKGAKPEPVDLDFKKICQEVWENIKTESDSLIIDNTMNFKADEGMTKVLLENIFKNSIEHGGENVTITAKITDDMMCISDDGVGIPEENIGEVFKSGYSGNNGTGLGMSIISVMCDSQGWDIRIDKDYTDGTKIDIIF